MFKCNIENIYLLLLCENKFVFFGFGGSFGVVSPDDENRGEMLVLCVKCNELIN